MNDFKTQRDYFGEALLRLGKKNRRVLALTADLGSSLGITGFKKEIPSRFFNLGVAEQNLIGVAVGLSLEGFIPFCTSFAVFLPGRCFDQIRVSICQNRANVKLIGGHLGFSNFGDGASAQAFEDLALVRSLPGLVTFCPFEGREIEALVNLAAAHSGPVYLRISKTEVPGNLIIDSGNKRWRVGGSRVLRTGRDLTILSHGPILQEVLKAVDGSNSFRFEVIDIYSLKPLDKEGILKSVAKTGRALVVEEHSLYGGLGSAVAELLSQEYPTPLRMVGVPDTFGESAQSWRELLRKYKMDSESLKIIFNNFLGEKI